MNKILSPWSTIPNHNIYNCIITKYGTNNIVAWVMQNSMNDYYYVMNGYIRGEVNHRVFNTTQLAMDACSEALISVGFEILSEERFKNLQLLI